MDVCTSLSRLQATPFKLVFWRKSPQFRGYTVVCVSTSQGYKTLSKNPRKSDQFSLQFGNFDDTQTAQLAYNDIGLHNNIVR